MVERLDDRNGVVVADKKHTNKIEQNILEVLALHVVSISNWHKRVHEDLFSHVLFNKADRNCAGVLKIAQRSF